MGHLESNQIPPRLAQLILYAPFVKSIPEANFKRLNDYFKITGSQYIIFDNESPFAQAFAEYQNPKYKDHGEISVGKYTYHIFEYPEDVRNAVLLNADHKDQLGTFPFDLQLSKVNDQIALDGFVAKFNTLIYQNDNIPLRVSYPTQESLLVDIPPKNNSRNVYINESFDSEWTAIFNGKKAEIRPTGPNFMLVTLPDDKKGGTLTLKHTWPLSFYISVYVIFFIPLALLLTRLVQEAFPVKLKREEAYL